MAKMRYRFVLRQIQGNDWGGGPARNFKLRQKRGRKREQPENERTKGRWKMELDIHNIIHEGGHYLSGIRLM